MSATLVCQTCQEPFLSICQISSESADAQKAPTIRVRLSRMHIGSSCCSRITNVRASPASCFEVLAPLPHFPSFVQCCAYCWATVVHLCTALLMGMEGASLGECVRACWGACSNLRPRGEDARAPSTPSFLRLVRPSVYGLRAGGGVAAVRALNRLHFPVKPLGSGGHGG